jgi:tRNA nucleotidyltransferase (CCA-adding enzyme)
MNLPVDAINLINLLLSNGYKAYAVGGCVRDEIMGRAGGDIDITSSATPLELEKILSDNNIKYIETGLKHGTVTAIVNHIPYEITTFRNDGEYLDNRHPVDVKYVTELSDDLARRDFTINAIAYNDSEGIVDLYNGVDDINNKIIRAVGEPNKRFNEDALRIMRALRFSSVLGFDIDKQTKQAIFDNKDLLLNIASERIYVELVKLLMGDNVEQVLTDYRDVLSVVIPEFKPCFDYPQNSKWHLYDVYTHIVKSVAVSPKKDYIRLSLLLHDIGKPFCKTTDENGQDHFKGHPVKSVELSKNILKRLKVSNDIYNKVTTLVEIHDLHITHKPSNIKGWLRRLGEDLTLDFIDVKIADMATHNLALAQNELDSLNDIKQQTIDIINSGEPYKISDLKINGNDLIKIGFVGHSISDELENLIKIVSGNPACNTYEKLIHQAKIDYMQTK